eukprot:3986273-Lingulodinium_polyedra.AAC.1
MGHAYSNDICLYLDGLDKILEELEEPASEDLVTTVVVPQLREASRSKAYASLAVDFDIFDRAAPSSPERSVEFLYKCARECLRRIDREAMRTSFTKAAAAAPVVPRGSPGLSPGSKPCYNWIRGECKLGSACKFEHDPKAAPRPGKGGGG